MPTKMNRILIPFIIVFFLSLGKQINSAGLAPASIVYLPTIGYNPSGWIGPFGGTIVPVVVDPSNPQVVYAGTFGSGVFKSTDGSNYWFSESRGLTNLEIQSLAIDPTNPSTLYAGTYRNQVFKSTDGGNSWSWSGTGMQDSAIVYSIVVDPVTPSNVYASTRGISNNNDKPWSGVAYKSTDAGQTWIPSLYNIGGAGFQDWVYSLAINPNNHNQVFAATHMNGPFRSDDYGATWHPINNGIDDPKNLHGAAISISPQPAFSSILYYGTWGPNSVYKSFNSGDSWGTFNSNIPSARVYSIAIDPFSVDTVYLATFSYGLLRTIDGGTLWENSGLLDDQLYSVAINPNLTNNIYVGTAGDGFYRSTDFAMSWERTNTGINNTMVTSVVHHPSNPNQLYSSVYGAGVFQSGNSGQTWEEMNSGLGSKLVHDLVMDPANPNLLYALTDTDGLFQNDLTNGLGWVPFGQGIVVNQRPMPAFPANHPFATLDMQENFATPQDSLTNLQATNAILLTMVYTPSNPAIAYMGTSGSGVYRSNDGGLSWQPDELGGRTIFDLAVDPLDPNLVYAATDLQGSLYFSTDSGNSWKDAYLPVYFYSVETSPYESGVVYAGTSSGIYRYQSGAWSALGLSDKAVTAIGIDPNRHGVLYAGTSSGAYYSTDNGLTWNPVDNQLSDQTILAITIDQTNPEFVFFSTKTHGIFLASIQH